MKPELRRSLDNRAMAAAAFQAKNGRVPYDRKEFLTFVQEMLTAVGLDTVWTADAWLGGDPPSATPVSVGTTTGKPTEEISVQGGRKVLVRITPVPQSGEVVSVTESNGEILGVLD